MCAHTPGLRGIGYVCARGPSITTGRGPSHPSGGAHHHPAMARGAAVRGCARVRASAQVGEAGCRPGLVRVGGPGRGAGGAGVIGGGGRGGFGTPWGPLGAGGPRQTAQKPSLIISTLL